jgi:hypothetical protein
MSIILFLLALTYFVAVGRRHPAPDTRELSVYAEGREPAAEVEAAHEAAEVETVEPSNGASSS